MKNLLQSIFNSVSEVFKSITTHTAHQSESTILKELKKKDLAINYAEKLIFLADKEENLSSDKIYKFYRRKFFKYNS